ncbi:energy-coupling factor transporter transmembrane component T [Companilactobacillus insicii]|uniref:energy-coupling factor transporter transmembrane component T n=1 Tax=Companilactobacillus insicii TaxID=1732567 RepID=UPI000F768453|nr:energy-coupling factor transporter transmembrane component T [Companilactobacillus insicii]
MKKIYFGFRNSTNNFSMLIYLLSVIISSLVFTNPLIIMAIFLSLLIMVNFVKREESKGYFKFSLIIFITTFLFNIIINQRGTNVIFQIPFLKVTFESLMNAGILAFSFVNLLLAFYIYDALTNVKIIFDLISRSFRSIAIIFILTIKFIPKTIEIFKNTNYLYNFRYYQSNNDEAKITQKMDLIEIVLNKSIANFMNVSDVLITKGYNNRSKVSKEILNNISDYILLLISGSAILFDLIMSFLKIGKVNFGSAKIAFLINSNILVICLINVIMILMPILIGVFQYLWWKWYISRTTVLNTPTVKNFR